MVAHAASRFMRGRLIPLAFVALAVLSPGVRAADVPAIVIGKNGDDDPCINPAALREDPSTILSIAAHCTFFLEVKVYENEQGRVVVSITFAIAEHGETFVVECTRPDRLPKPALPGHGPGERYGPCWDTSPAWMT